MTAISCVGLSRSFGPVRAVDGVSFSIERGSIFALLGPNGAGKTTTIHLLLGLLHPDSGTATVAGLDPTTRGDAVRARSGALLEHNGVYERLTALENLEVFGRIARMSALERSARSRELLQRFGLWERRDARAGSFSRGMKQKLAVARALLHRPEIVFLDEPTSGLDPEAADDLRNMIESNVHEEQMTVFLNTHNLLDAERLSTTVAILGAGRLLAIGTPAEIRARTGSAVRIRGAGLRGEIVDFVRGQTNVESVTLSDGALSIAMPASASVADIIRALVERGVAIEEVRRDSGGFEEAFLRIVREHRA